MIFFNHIKHYIFNNSIFNNIFFNLIILTIMNKNIYDNSYNYSIKRNKFSKYNKIGGRPPRPPKVPRILKAPKKQIDANLSYKRPKVGRREKYYDNNTKIKRHDSKLKALRGQKSLEFLQARQKLYSKKKEKYKKKRDDVKKELYTAKTNLNEFEREHNKIIKDLVSDKANAKTPQETQRIDNIIRQQRRNLANKKMEVKILNDKLQKREQSLNKYAKFIDKNEKRIDKAKTKKLKLNKKERTVDKVLKSGLVNTEKGRVGIWKSAKLGIGIQARRKRKLARKIKHLNQTERNRLKGIIDNKAKLEQDIINEKDPKRKKDLEFNLIKDTSEIKKLLQNAKMKSLETQKNNSKSKKKERKIQLKIDNLSNKQEYLSNLSNNNYKQILNSKSVSKINPVLEGKQTNDNQTAGANKRRDKTRKRKGKKQTIKRKR